MGQQQLFLVVLSMLIVGVAVVVGIAAFGENARNANQDEIHEALMDIGARSQWWYRRPVQTGGGGRSFAGITFARINFNPNHLSGTFTISNLQPGSFRVTGTSNAGNMWSLSVIVYPDSITLAP